MRTIKNITILISIIALSVTNIYAQDRLTLPRAIELTLYNNYDIQLAEKSTEIAGISNSWGMAGRYPTISLNAGSNYASDILEDGAPGVVTSSASANVQWLLFGGMRVNINKSMLNLRHELAQGQEELQIENTLKSIILAYYGIVIEQELLDLYKSSMELSEDRLKREQIAYELGGTDTFELIQAQSSFNADKKKLLAQNRNLRSMVIQLNQLMNVDINTTWEFDENIELPNSDYSLSEMSAIMLLDNKNIKNQYINQRLSQESVGLAKSALYPTVSLDGGVRYGNTYLPNGSTSINTFTPSVGLNLSFNLYNGSTTKKNIQISMLESEASSITTESMISYLTSQLAYNFNAYNYNKELVEVSNSDVESSKTLLDISTEKLKNGSLSSLDFRQVQLSYLESIYSYAVNSFELIKSNIELAYLMGNVISK